MIIKAIFIDLFLFPKETFSYLPSNIWSISSPYYLNKTIQKQINLSEFQNSIQYFKTPYNLFTVKIMVSILTILDL